MPSHPPAPTTHPFPRTSTLTGGFTPQYKELQALQDKYGPRGFLVLAFPCNQFGGQEPGTAAEVCTLMKNKFEVTFPIMVRLCVCVRVEIYIGLSKSNRLDPKHEMIDQPPRFTSPRNAHTPQHN